LPENFVLSEYILNANSRKKKGEDKMLVKIAKARAEVLKVSSQTFHVSFFGLAAHHQRDFEATRKEAMTS
jgi:hypothetical protein